jgi:hypothetical protein
MGRSQFSKFSSQKLDFKIGRCTKSSNTIHPTSCGKFWVGMFVLQFAASRLKAGVNHPSQPENFVQSFLLQAT